MYFICWFGVIKKYYKEINRELPHSQVFTLTVIMLLDDSLKSLLCDTLQVVGRFRVRVVS